MEDKRVMVDFGRPYVPEPGERDVSIEDISLRESRYGQVVVVTLMELSGPHQGKTFAVLFGKPNRVTERSRLGQFLVQMGLPVREWAEKGETVDIAGLLLGKRIRIVTGIATREGQSGSYKVATIAAIKKVYRDGEGPQIPEHEVPF